MSGNTGAMTMDEVEKKVKRLYAEGDPQNNTSKYTEWSKDYDNDVAIADYNAHVAAVRGLSKFVTDKSCRILDVCAGTGLVGEELVRCGFSRIDAHDGNAEMLELARKKNIYAKLYCEMMFASTPTPGLEENAYDAAITVGSFYPGGILPDVVSEILRVVKRTGLVVITMNLTHPSPYTPQEFQAMLKTLEDEGRLAVKYKEEYERHMFGNTGIIYVLEKL